MMKIILALSLTLGLNHTLFANCVETEKKSAQTTQAAQATNTSIARAVASNTNNAGDKMQIKVPKMVCMSCAAKIRKALRDDLKLQDITFDIENKTVSFPCPADKCSSEKVAISLDKIGYTFEAL
jgi:copper chaperone CopZ